VPSRKELYDKLIGICLSFASCRKAERRRVAEAFRFKNVPSIPTRTMRILSNPNAVGLDFCHDATVRYPAPRFYSSRETRPRSPVASLDRAARRQRPAAKRPVASGRAQSALAPGAGGRRMIRIGSSLAAHEAIASTIRWRRIELELSVRCSMRDRYPRGRSA